MPIVSRSLFPLYIPKENPIRHTINTSCDVRAPAPHGPTTPGLALRGETGMCRFCFTCLFRSMAANEHRWLPTITPSGLSMGTILKTNLSRNAIAWGRSDVR